MADVYDILFGQKGNFITTDEGRVVFISGPGSGGGGTGADVQGPTSVEWAQGVIAARGLGGQVPQSAVNKAEGVLQRAGLAPSERKAPKTFKDIGAFYETTRPITGDIWSASGITIEVGKIERSGTGGSAIDINIITGKGGRVSTLYTTADWSTS